MEPMIKELSREWYSHLAISFLSRSKLHMPGRSHNRGKIICRLMVCVCLSLFVCGLLPQPRVRGQSSQSSQSAAAWSRLPDLPHPVLSPGLVSQSGKIYLIGGGRVVGKRVETFNSVTAYDPVTRKWQTKSPMPTGRSNFGTVSVEGRIYVIGGTPNDSTNSLPIVEAYDPATDHWSRKADMPTPRSLLSVAALGTTVYAIGGNAGHEFVVEAYDARTDRWTKKANAPRPKRGPAVAAIGNRIFVIGGSTTDSFTVVDSTEEYDPAVDRWVVRASMPTARCDHAAAALGGRVFVFGGWNRGPVDAVEEFDPQANRWSTRTALPHARQFLAATTLGGRVYIAGGAEKLPASSPAFDLYAPDFDGSRDLPQVSMPDVEP